MPGDVLAACLTHAAAFYTIFTPLRGKQLRLLQEILIMPKEKERIVKSN